MPVPIVPTDKVFRRAKRTSSEDCATEVWVALEQAGEDGLTLPELMEETNLSHSQVKAGLREINHVKQLANEQPIIVDPSGGYTYILPEFFADLLPWTINRANDLRTRLQAEQQRIEAAAAKWPTEVGRVIPRMIARLVEDLGELLALVGEKAE